MKTWKHGIFAIIAFAVVVIACGNGNENESQLIDPDFVGIEGLTMDNYPRVDGATSTNPLNVIIASKLLDFEYIWEGDHNLIEIRQAYLPMGLPTSFRNKFKLSQTHGAIINLIDNQTDLIIVASKMSAEEKQYADAAGVTLIETPIALDALDFVINTQNTVTSLTVEQIQEIYLGDITNWSQVGGANEEIKPFYRNENSGSQEMMNEVVMKNTGVPNWADRWADELPIFSMSNVYYRILENPYGICYSPHYYKEYMVAAVDGIKTLAVNGITPDSNSIKNKSYPFVAEVYVSIRSDLDHNSMAYKLYEWLQTETGKRVIKESGYVPN